MIDRVPHWGWKIGQSPNVTGSVDVTESPNVRQSLSRSRQSLILELSSLPIDAEEFDRDRTVPEAPELEYRLNPSNRDCKCCVHPDINEVDRLFMRRELSGLEAAQRLGVSPAYYSTHVHRDIQRPVKEQLSPIVAETVQSAISQIGELGKIFSALVYRSNVLLRTPLDDKAEFRIKAIVSEARAYGEFLLRVEGQLKDSPLVVINQLNVQFRQVIEIIMAEAPTPLKQKIATLLKEAELNSLENHR